MHTRGIGNVTIVASSHGKAADKPRYECSYFSWPSYVRKKPLPPASDDKGVPSQTSLQIEMIQLYSTSQASALRYVSYLWVPEALPFEYS